MKFAIKSIFYELLNDQKSFEIGLSDCMRISFDFCSSPSN
jgi:hypothetical protein